MELGFLVLAIAAIFTIIVTIATFVAEKISKKEIESTQNIYFGKLANSDASIQDAMEYLKLTNGISERS